MTVHRLVLMSAAVLAVPLGAAEQLFLCGGIALPGAARPTASQVGAVPSQLVGSMSALVIFAGFPGDDEALPSYCTCFFRITRSQNL